MTSAGTVITGASSSRTVTVAVTVELLPELSVPVNVTVLAPRLSQSNDVTSSDNVTSQLSDEPLSISAVVIVAAPLASRLTVASIATIVGAISSTTVTVAVTVELLPELSVPVNVTVLAPRLSQSNDVTSSDNVTSQLSADPLSTSAVVIVAAPLASRDTWIS